MTDQPTSDDRTPLEQAIDARGNPGVVVGGLIALIAFFLPYASSPSFLGMQISRSGAQIGGALWLVLLAAIVIIAVYLLMPGERYRKDRLTLTLASSVVGMLILLFGVIKLYSKKNVLGVEVAASDFGIHLNVGGIASFVGFALAFMVAFSERNKKSAVTAAQELFAPALSEASRGIEALAERTKVTAPEVGDWISRQGSVGKRWLSQNRKRIGAGLVVLLLGVVAFGVFRPSPVKDASRIAAAFRACDDASKREVENQQQVLISEFRSKPPATRRSAYDRIEQVVNPIRAAYSKCVESAEAEYTQAASRYEGTSERGARFFTELQKYWPGARPTAGSFSTTTRYEDQLQAEIAKVMPPWPSNDRVIQDLLGKTVDGWTFAYPSEFLQITADPNFKTVAQQNSLTKRLHMQLDDYNTHDKYFAIVDVTYNIPPADDDWSFGQVRELYLTKSDTLKYREAGELFLIGKWRWPGNYALYNSDGSWSGRWDDGTEHAGEWRIVHDNLVLTRDGSPWYSAPIVERADRAFVVEYNGHVRAERVD